ncbi:hypothetical protein ACWDBD_11505 [Streptomyces sp. NPDC001118]
MKAFDFEAAIPAADPGRYHLILTAAGEPLMHGWWNDFAVAHRKFRSWVGEYGSLTGARILLVDKEAGEALAVWPDESPGVVSGPA